LNQDILLDEAHNTLALLRKYGIYMVFYFITCHIFAIIMPIPDLDKTDVKILDKLQSDARASHQELSDLVHLSAPQCFRRVKKMEEAGVIDRYVALVNPAKVGLGVTAFVSVSLKSGQMKDLQKFKTVVAAIPEILECHTVTGESDYLLKVVAPDLQVFSRFLLERLVEHFDVVSTKSEVSLEQIKYTTVLPLA